MKKKTVAFDFETIPNRSMIGLLDEPTSGLKQPADYQIKIDNLKAEHAAMSALGKSVKAIETNLAKNRIARDQAAKALEEDLVRLEEKQISDMGFKPLLNIICCAGFCDSDGNMGHVMLKDEDSEKSLLQAFWDILSRYDHFVTFNGRGFDMRCLYFHSIMHDVAASVDIDSGRYDRGNHTDLMHVLNGSNMPVKGQNLNFYAKLLLGDHKTEGIDGSEVWDYWMMGDKEFIAEYCEKDCKLTMDLFKKVQASGFLDALK